MRSNKDPTQPKINKLKKKKCTEPTSHSAPRLKCRIRIIIAVTYPSICDVPRCTSVISFNLIFEQPYDVSGAITIFMTKDFAFQGSKVM